MDYYFILMIFLGAAVVSDFCFWRIPNQLILAGLISGIMSGIFHNGMAVGLRHSLTGGLLPLICLILLFRFKVIGGGDIKLLSLTGSFVGADIIYIIFFSFIFGGILSVIYILKVFWFRAMHHSRFSTTGLPEQKGHQGCIHFSLAIFAGTVYYLLSG